MSMEDKCVGLRVEESEVVGGWSSGPVALACPHSSGKAARQQPIKEKSEQ